MAGFDIKEGLYDDREVTDDELWAALSCVFSSRSRNTSSYKYGLLKSIIDNLYNIDDDYSLSFDQLFSKFTEIYWNLILKYRVRQKAKTVDNRNTHLEKILESAVKNYQIPVPIPFENLSAQNRSDISHAVLKKCKTYVVGALYEDTRHLFYSFSKKDERLSINPKMHKFVCKHKVLIEKLNYYEWACFLEKINADSPTVHLLKMIDESTKRNNLSVYRHILFDEFEYTCCFYCGRKLDPKTTDVDHFIPWSFLKEDNLWNLVLSCYSCNRAKNDKLPDDRYLDLLETRNKRLLAADKTLEMQSYRDQTIRNIYEWAKINGYDHMWDPMKKTNRKAPQP